MKEDETAFWHDKTALCFIVKKNYCNLIMVSASLKLVQNYLVPFANSAAKIWSITLS